VQRTKRQRRSVDKQSYVLSISFAAECRNYQLYGYILWDVLLSTVGRWHAICSQCRKLVWIVRPFVITAKGCVFWMCRLSSSSLSFSTPIRQHTSAVYIQNKTNILYKLQKKHQMFIVSQNISHCQVVKYLLQCVTLSVSEVI